MWFKNFSIFTIAIIIPIILFEIGLRIDGRYSNLVSVELYGSNTIWTRYPNERRTTQHPDKHTNIEIYYNQYGSRDDYLFKLSDRERNIGFFGDSFTENLRIENRFTFNNLLSELSLNSEIMNFGVDGFGTAQSFQRWLNIKDQLNLDVVIYIFCANDLRNTYEAEIFDRQLFSQGEIKNILPTQVPLHISIANSFHLTYLTIEAYFKIKSILNNISEPGIGLYNERFGDRFSEGWIDHRRKFHDPYADSILTEFLTGNISQVTLETLDHMMNIIERWREMVEKEGGTFLVAVLPTQADRMTADKLFTNLETIRLLDTSEVIQLRDDPWYFERDDHWNEYGNLAGAISLHNFLQDQEGLNFIGISEEWINRKREEIQFFYDE